MSKWISLMVLAGLVEAVGDVAFKQWSTPSGRSWMFTIGVLAYVGATMLWAPTLKEGKDLYRMLGVFFCGNLILGTAIGCLGYSEKITLQSGLGLIFALAAIILLAVEFK